MMESVRPGEMILLLWSGTEQIEALRPEVERINAKVASAKLNVENAERLLLSRHGASKFDAAFSSLAPPFAMTHSDEVLAEVARVLKPGGRFTLAESIPSPARPTTDFLLSALKLAGFVSATVPTEGTTSGAVFVECQKPDFEVGASTALKLVAKKKDQQINKAASDSKPRVWTLDALDADDDDLMDPDSLIDDVDFVKPDPLSLKYDCGANKAGKKKACKNCVCGLAEELEAGKPVTTRSATSACGSCYLGDAFRCASCPYLGMPAFKPGEKIQLTDRQLKGDA